MAVLRQGDGWRCSGNATGGGVSGTRKRLVAPALLFLCVFSTVGARGQGNIHKTDVDAARAKEVSQCEVIVDEFIRKRHHPIVFPKSSVVDRKFVHFLHFPRTAGRSFFSCFLFKAFPPTHRCAPSYNALQLEMSPPDCQVMGTHDDFSITDFFPKGYHIISQFRDPVDRFLSAYEFAVEVSSRNFRLENTRRSEKMEGKEGADEPKELKPRKSFNASSTANTRDVWPWSYLVPYFDESIDEAVHKVHYQYKLKKTYANPAPEKTWVPALTEDGQTYYWHRETRESKWNLTDAEMEDALPFLDPFDNSLMISLKDFAEEPVAQELLHNGMTFQVLGITNYSYWPEAAAVRNCMTISPSAERKLMALAKGRIDNMAHVSLTAKLPESSMSLAGTLNFPLDSPIYEGAKTVLNRPGVEKLGDLDERYNSMSQNFSAYSNVDILDLNGQAYKEYMDYQVNLRNRYPEEVDPDDYWRQREVLEEKKLIFRNVQSEILRRRKELDNGAVIPHPKMVKPHKTQSKRDKLWSSFSKCNGSTKTKQGSKKYKSTVNVAHADGRRAYFTKQARKNLSKELLDRIRELSWLDDELFQYALKVYDKQILQQINEGLFAKPVPHTIIPHDRSAVKPHLPFIKPMNKCYPPGEI